MNETELKEEQKPILIQIPSITTKSFEIIGKHICSLYPEVSIIELQTKHKIANADVLPIDTGYGVKFFSADSKELNIEYTQKINLDTAIVENPFNIDMYNRIMKYINQYLGKFEDRYKKEHGHDLSIEYLILRAKNKELQSMVGTKTDEFLMFFLTTKHESITLREQLIESHIRIDKEYLFEAGFKHTSLNLIQLIEAEKYYENMKDKKRSIIYWKGFHKQDLNPIANNSIARYLRYNSGYFPADFIKLKRFYITKTNVIRMLDGGI